jgi:hypothetical protein
MEDGVWHPSAAVVAQIQQKIRPAVEVGAKAQGRKLRPWNEYSFEYQGRISAGKRFVYIFATCQSPSESDDLASMASALEESCAFGIFFDPRTGEFTFFRSSDGS